MSSRDWRHVIFRTEAHAIRKKMDRLEPPRSAYLLLTMNFTLLYFTYPFIFIFA